VGVVSLILLAYGSYSRIHPGLPDDSAEKVFVGMPREARSDRAALELHFLKLREKKRSMVGAEGVNYSAQYEDDIPYYVDKLRGSSVRSRRANHLTQVTTIVGSLAATGVSSLSLSVDFLRWASPVITFIVGMASGLAAYFKFKDRGFYSQQTANSIEQEIAAYQLGIGRYKRIAQQDARLEFLETVHRLRVEQENREQNLDQPARKKGEGE
jgi:hypothetical protein